jgi:putative PIN family toxin of toxin-antitoxin system
MRGRLGDSERPRVTVDTNLFVSGLIGRGAPHRLVRAWAGGRFDLVLSPELLSEVAEVLRRPAIRDRYGVTEAQVRRLQRRLERLGDVVPAPEELPAGIAVRDPKDRHVLAAAIRGGARYLVTGDRDLLALRGRAELGGLEIVSVNEFLGILEIQ